MIEPSATDKFAISDDGGPTEIVVNFVTIVGGRKSAADQDAAAVGDVLEQAVFDDVARATVNGSAVGEEGRLCGAVGDDVLSGWVSLRFISGRPDGKTIVAGAAALRPGQPVLAGESADPAAQRKAGNARL